FCAMQLGFHMGKEHPVEQVRRLLAVFNSSGRPGALGLHLHVAQREGDQGPVLPDNFFNDPDPAVTGTRPWPRINPGIGIAPLAPVKSLERPAAIPPIARAQVALPIIVSER